MGDSGSRRDFLGDIFTSAGKVVTRRIGKVANQVSSASPNAQASAETYLNLLRAPDSIRVFSESDVQRLDALRGGLWAGNGVTVKTTIQSDRMRLNLEAPGMEPTRIAVRWQADLTGVRRYLSDHWERAYGDLEWRAETPERPMPWYFMAYDGKRTHGYGVVARPSAFCFWTADRSGITLWLDVRNGGKGVVLGEREVELCEVVSSEGTTEESSFEALQAFCRKMSPWPRMAGDTFYGANDWYSAYGNSTAERTLEAARIVGELAPNVPNRPFFVVDAGWSPGGIEAAPFDQGNDRFGDMAVLASNLKDLGIRPGIWIRPLVSSEDMPEEWRLSRDRKYLDPTHPDVASYITETISRLGDWGYELIKHDFTSWDLFGKWGFEMGAGLTEDGWSFYDRSRTNAEILNDLYDRIRWAAGPVYLLGCNTFGHLSAGVFEINRVGDDTSGRDWERTRRMGVNALAFRAAQQGTFYAADPDVAALTPEHNGKQALDWLRLVSSSGVPLFVSIDPSSLGPGEWSALRDAFALAAEPQPVAEPLDWLNSSCPRRWRLRGEKVEFDWSTPDGPNPFSA